MYIDTIDLIEEDGTTSTYKIRDNDSNYITRNVNNLTYYTPTTVLERDYQPLLEAGSNILLQNNVISAVVPTIPLATASTDGLMSASDFERLSNVISGAEPNVINTIILNGTALTPNVNKEVSISIPIMGINVNGSTASVTVTDRIANLSVIEDVCIAVSPSVPGSTIVTNGVAKIVTNTAYDASANKIATMADIPTVPGTIVADIKMNNVSIVSGQIANLSTQTAYNATDNKLATMADINNIIMQYSEMPLPNSGRENQIVQYVGVTNGTYTQGYFYKCVSDEAEEPTYGWARIDTQPSGGSGGDTTDVQINGYSITANNIANIITESSYDAESNKIATMEDIPTLVQSDWNEADSGSLAYIQNKPNLSQYLTAAYFTTITGYVATATQTLKNINGTLTWVTDTI